MKNPLAMGPHFWKKKEVKSVIFEGEKSLDIDMGFRPRAAHPVKK